MAWGIAVSALAATLFAMILKQRVSNWAADRGSRAAGQFGTAQAVLVLGVLQDRHRSRGQELWACFVDFKKSYDTVPRQRLWEKLQVLGVGGTWPQAVQALNADVPMSVRTTDGLPPCFQARLGLPVLGEGSRLAPLLLYAHDMVLLATSAAGLQRQLNLLQCYCRQWGLTLNIVKTKLLLLSGQETQEVGPTFGGQPLEAATSFK